MRRRRAPRERRAGARGRRPRPGAGLQPVDRDAGPDQVEVGPRVRIVAPLLAAWSGRCDARRRARPRRSPGRLQLHQRGLPVARRAGEVRPQRRPGAARRPTTRSTNARRRVGRIHARPGASRCRPSRARRRRAGRGRGRQRSRPAVGVEAGVSPAASASSSDPGGNSDSTRMGASIPASRSRSPSSTSATPIHDGAGLERGARDRDVAVPVRVGLHHRHELRLSGFSTPTLWRIAARSTSTHVGRSRLTRPPASGSRPQARVARCRRRASPRPTTGRPGSRRVRGRTRRRTPHPPDRAREPPARR